MLTGGRERKRASSQPMAFELDEIIQRSAELDLIEPNTSILVAKARFTRALAMHCMHTLAWLISHLSRFNICANRALHYLLFIYLYFSRITRLIHCRVERERKIDSLHVPETLPLYALFLECALCTRSTTPAAEKQSC